MNLKNLLALMFITLLSFSSFSTVYGELIGSDILGKKGGESKSEYSNNIGTVSLGEIINIRTVVVFTGDDKDIQITSPTGAPIGSSKKKQGCEQVNINKGIHTNFTLSAKNTNTPCEFELILDYENTQVGTNIFRLFLDGESRQSVRYQGTENISISSAKTKDFDGDGSVTHIRVNFSAGFDLDKVDKNEYTIRLGGDNQPITALSGANGEGDFVDFELENALAGDARPSIKQSNYDDGDIYFEQTSFLRTSDRVAPILNINLDDGGDTEFEDSIDIDVSLTEEGRIYYGYGLDNKSDLKDEGSVLNYTDSEKTITIQDKKTLYIMGEDFADNETKLWSHSFSNEYDLELDVSGNGKINLTWNDNEDEITDSESFGMIFDTKIKLQAEEGKMSDFDGWDGDICEGKGKSCNFDMPGEDISITANFETKKFEVILEQNPQDVNATLTGAGSYEVGKVVELQAGDWDQDYQFEKWTSDDLDEINNVESAMEANFDMPGKDVVVVANFEEKDEATTPSPGGGGGGGGTPICREHQMVCEKHMGDYIWQRVDGASCRHSQLGQFCDPEDVDEEDHDEDIDDEEEKIYYIEEIDDEYEETIEADEQGRVVRRGQTSQGVRESLTNRAPQNLQPAMNQVSDIFEREVEYIENRSLVSDNLFWIKEELFDNFRKTFEKVLDYRQQRDPVLAQQALDYYQDYEKHKQQAKELISSYIKEVDIPKINKTVYQARDKNLNQIISLLQDMIFDKIIELYNTNQITEDELDEYVQVYNEFIWSVVVFNIERNEISRSHARAMINDFVYYYQMEIIEIEEETIEETTDEATFNYQRNLSVGVSGDDVENLQNYLISQGYWTDGVSATGYFGNVTLSHVQDYLSQEHNYNDGITNLSVDLLQEYF